MSKTQTMFGENGAITDEVKGMKIGERRRYVKYLADMKDLMQTRAVCPWCLHVSVLGEFARASKRWEIMKTFTCPVCGVNMREPTTRIFDRGAFDYSEWFWDQIYTWRGYEKVWGGDEEGFKKLSQRVKDLGFAATFWDIQRAKKSHREIDRTAYRSSAVESFKGSRMDYYKDKEKEQNG